MSHLLELKDGRLVRVDEFTEVSRAELDQLIQEASATLDGLRNFLPTEAPAEEPQTAPQEEQPAPQPTEEPVAEAPAEQPATEPEQPTAEPVQLTTTSEAPATTVVPVQLQ